MHSSIGIKRMRKNMDFIFFCQWLGFVGFLFGCFGFSEERELFYFLILILFLKYAVHISAKRAAHINEASWVL